MTIQELIQALEKYTYGTPVKTLGGDVIGNRFGSDRGDYSNMYIAITELAPNCSTVYTTGDLVDLLYKALSEGTMLGYKGGEFNIERDTLVTLGGYGYMGNSIVGVTTFEDECRIIEEE